MELPDRVDELKAALGEGQSLSPGKPGAKGPPGIASSGMPGKPARRIVLQGDSGTSAATGTGTGARFVSP